MRPGGVIAAQGDPATVMTAELVEEVFGLPCRIIDDPETGTPLMVPAAPRRYEAEAGARDRQGAKTATVLAETP
jgi:iron complex transport system ATP-binding protein